MFEPASDDLLHDGRLDAFTDARDAIHGRIHHVIGDPGDDFRNGDVAGAGEFGGVAVLLHDLKPFM